MTAASAASAAAELPRLAGLDHSRAFLADPYRFIARACRQAGSDAVLLRLMLQPTIAMTGPDAARLFYDKELFTRERAAPEPVKGTLFGKGGVQALDGNAHLLRKAFFLDAMLPARVSELALLVEQYWHVQAQQWERRGMFTLYEGMQALLTRAVCRWAGVPLQQEELGERTRQLTALFDQAASGVGAHLRARRARHRAEAWLAELIAHSREGAEPFAQDSVAFEAARLRGSDGQLLPPRVAAVELLNVLRPTVAVSVFVVLAAHAMHTHSQYRAALASRDTRLLRAFVQEVRRFYPFFPALAARTRREFTWRGMRFPADTRAMLDLYGTNHDPRCWQAPQEFRPERFLDHEPGRFEFIPQGGARAEDHHRCPGEGATIALMETVLPLLARSDYELPAQDLALRMDRMPALPASGIVLRTAPQ